MKVIIEAIWYPRQSSLLWTNQTANMSRETNEGSMMCCKTIKANVLTIVRLLVEPITSLAKPKAYLESYISIMQTLWTVTSINHVIYPSFSSFFSFWNMLISNRYWWSAVLGSVGNSSGRCGGRNVPMCNYLMGQKIYQPFPTPLKPLSGSK